LLIVSSLILKECLLSQNTNLNNKIMKKSLYLFLVLPLIFCFVQNGTAQSIACETVKTAVAGAQQAAGAAKDVAAVTAEDLAEASAQYAAVAAIPVLLDLVTHNVDSLVKIEGILVAATAAHRKAVVAVADAAETVAYAKAAETAACK
jgi:hypothetical protein